AAFALGLSCAFPASADSDTAALILAVDGTSQWMKTVKRAAREAQLSCPYKIFYGDGDTSDGVRRLQEEVRDLENDGAHTIYAVPVLISGYSDVARQWKYLLGAGVQPGFINNPVFPIEKHATVRFMEPLNDSAVTVEILLDRAQEISEDPSKESVIIVTNGPSDDSDNAKWIQILLNLSDRIQKRGGFKSVEGFTLREDARAQVRSQAVQGLRDRVEAIDKANSRALLVSLLLSPGGIEHKIGLELRGLNYAFNTKTLLPDSRISEWIRSQLP
ncbi:MAG TPA: hypothetical protein VMU17_05450, partial [Elusimicrobiota bacterium]|nr:hypothetical protein [Elusimicrobiota bacterium]